MQALCLLPQVPQPASETYDNMNEEPPMEYDNVDFIEGVTDSLAAMVVSELASSQAADPLPVSDGR